MTGPNEDLADLVSAARSVRDELHRDGDPLTRDNLATRLRGAGHRVGNARLTSVLRALRTETASLAPEADQHRAP